MRLASTQSVLDDLLACGFHIQALYDAPLAEWTTFRLGGRCPCLITCQRPDELENALRRLMRENIKFILIGGGSNLVVSDHGIECVVIRYVSDKPLLERQGTEIVVSASTALDDLALFAMEQSLEGLNYASGIPGTVGGAIVGNAGAFGKQVGDYLKSVDLISPSGEKKQARADQLGFRYRHSDLKETGDIVVSARFALSPGNRESLLKERQEILDLRRSKHPDLKIYPCAGSFFRNIEPTSKAERRQATGWFLEQAGGKDLRSGGAVIFEKHANIIVKSDGCTAQDVFELSKKMAELVKKAYGLDLIREVRFVGKFSGMQTDLNHIIW